MNYNDEVINKILGKASLEINYFQDWEEQRKLRNVLELILYDYDIQSKCTALVKGDIPEKLQMFLACKKIEAISQKTLKNYYSEIFHFSNFINKPIRSITHNDVRMYIAVACNHCAETTKATKISVLKSFFQWLQDEEYVERNIMNKIKAPKIPKRLREGLSHEEVELLREACETDREKAMLEFFVATGCRAAEVESLKLSDLNFNDLSFRVVGKGNKERLIYFTARVKILIQKYVANRKGNDIDLFCSGKVPYSHLGKRSIQREIANIAHRAGINKRIYPHLLRHTFCTFKANSGINMTALQELMGHSSLATTQRYFKINNDLIKSEYKRLT